MYKVQTNAIEEMHPESEKISRRLRKLRGWNNGRNHIIFEYSDAPCLPFDIGQGIVAKAGLSEYHLREKHDISMPLFGMVEFPQEARRVPPDNRDYLLTFRGTRSERSDAMRKELRRIHNDYDILMLVACRWFGEPVYENNGNGYDEKCKEDEVNFEKYTFTEVSIGSKFALIVEGFGYATFRLTEMMSAGSIPVILIDHYVLPYDDILDWENFSIRIPEHKLEQVPDILRAIPAERVAAMHARLVFVYETFFRSLGTQVHLAIESVRINLFTADREAERVKLITNGFPHELSADDLTTPQKVIDDSKWCNTPLHRRQKVRDGAVMRR